MRRIVLIVQMIILSILLINFFYYRNLYRKQVNYIVELLDRQVRIVGSEVDSINYAFGSDLDQILFSGDLDRFFEKTRPDIKNRIIEQLKLFFSKYRDFVVKIRLYDDNLNEYTLAKDDSKNEWIESEFISLEQKPVEPKSDLIRAGNDFNYYVVIFKNGKAYGNIVATVDYQKYFNRLFSKYNLKNYQWQWVITEDGEIVFDNNELLQGYSKIDNIINGIQDGMVANITHTATDGNKTFTLLSSYYSTQLLRRDLGIVFSAPTDFFQKYIIRNSVLIVTGTIILVQIIILVLWRYLKKQKARLQELSYSEETLKKLIEEMPVGVLIFNNKREILKANKIAASYYSYPSESKMTGKIFPEITVSIDNEYYSKHLGGTFSPDQFIILKKPGGELILYRSSIPVVYQREEATLELLIDVTMLESARKEEARANIAKTEFLARMSYEIRTPLNGIIGMADLLNKYDLTPEIRDIVYLLRRSTEVLLGIVNDILDFSKIESGKMILEEIPFSIREEIFYAVDLTKPYALEKNVTIFCEINEKVPETVIGDPYRLRQVLCNLVNHSIVNTRNGEVHIRCSLKSHKDGIVILGFEILDTGKAFEKTELKKIFGDIVRVEPLMPKGSSNESIFTTLIARQLVEMMGGKLNAESPSGIAGKNGTKISFNIQVFSNMKIEKTIKVPGIKNISQLKVLVITGPHGRDEEILAVLHKSHLRFSVTSFTKTIVKHLQAQAAIASEKYDLLIITDDENFDGVEAAKILWENKLSPIYRILMVTSNDRKGNYLKCLTYGIDYYLVKPFNPRELQNILMEMFRIESDSVVPPSADVKFKDLNILIVEDNKMNQNILVKMLESLGFQADLAEEGYQGYLMAKGKKYDVVFMDLILPELDGYELSRRILEVAPDTLIIAITADNMPETKKKAELCGIREFMSKPVRLDDLKHLFLNYFKI